MTKQYPKDEEIKVEWTKIHYIMIFGVTLVLLFFIYKSGLTSITLTKWLSVVGLYIDIIGVVIASLKTPYYGLFADGGKIEMKRQEKEKNYFQLGMLLIAIGMILQAISTLLQ